MSEENKVKDIIDATTGLVKAVPIYQDLIQPASKELGKSLETVAKTVNLALAPISVLVWGYDQIKEFVSNKVSERLKNIPPENIIAPKPNVAGPTLEALRYTGHEESLADLYANLLASAMDKSTASGAHPAFVEIIKQLTPDEAKLLKIFSVDMPLPLISVRWDYKPGLEGKTGGQYIINHYSELGELAKCDYPSLTPAYIDNLCRLGLTTIPPMSSYTTPGVYEKIKNAELIQSSLRKIEENPELTPTIEEHRLKVTELGNQFIEVCVKAK